MLVIGADRQKKVDRNDEQRSEHVNNRTEEQLSEHVDKVLQRGSALAREWARAADED